MGGGLGGKGKTAGCEEKPSQHSKLLLQQADAECDCMPF